MHISYILAILVEAIVVILCVLTIGANMTSDNPNIPQMQGVAPIFLVGSGIAGMVAATHWMHMSW